MALTILKNTPTHAVVKVYDDTDTIELTALALESQSADAPLVNIKSIYWMSGSESSAISITRDETVLYTLPANDEGMVDFIGFVDNELNNEDIVVSATNGAVVILVLIKVTGYGDEEHPYQSLPAEEE